MKNQNKRNIIFDIIAVIICLAGSATAFTFFFSDLYSTLTKQEERPIGSIQFKKRTAQRRFNDRVIWSIVKDNSPIYNGDVIHTADLSEATIILEGGEKIALAENSLIHVYYNVDGARVELSGGSVNLATSENGLKLTLVSAGTEVDLKSGSALSAITGSAGGASVQVLSGDAVLSNANGRLNVASGDALTLGKDGSADLIPQIAVLAPLPGITLLNPNSNPLPVTFSWNTINFQGNETVKLEVSSDRKFSYIVASINMPANINSTVFNLSQGIYFWRAFPVTAASGSASDSVIINKFTLVSASIPKLSAPSNGENFNYRTKPPALQFRWTGASKETESNEYQLTIADNPALDDVFISAKVRGNFYQNAAIKNGLWYWQVVPVFNDAIEYNLKSIIYSFSLNQNIEIPAVQLLTPEDEREFIINTTNEVRFSWQKNDEASNYNIILSDNPRFKNPLINNTTNDLFLVWRVTSSELHEGGYYWQVTAVDSDGNRSKPSDIRMFSAKIPKVPITAPENLMPRATYRIGPAVLRQSRSLRLSWNTVSGANAYILTMRRADNNTIIITTILYTNSWTIPNLATLGNGEFIWQIEGIKIDSQGLITERGTSASSRFIIDVPKPEKVEALPPSVPLYGRE